jgi:hypothetical protein
MIRIVNGEISQEHHRTRRSWDLYVGGDTRFQEVSPAVSFLLLGFVCSRVALSCDKR